MSGRDGKTSRQQHRHRHRRPPVRAVQTQRVGLAHRFGEDVGAGLAGLQALGSCFVIRGFQICTRAAQFAAQIVPLLVSVKFDEPDASTVSSHPEPQRISSVGVAGV